METSFSRTKLIAFAVLGICVVGIAALFVIARMGPDKEDLLERAEEFYAAGKYDEAKIEFMNLLREDNMNPKAFARLGIIWFDQGAALQAYPYLNKAKELTPDSLEVRIRLAYAHQAVGRMAAARKEAMELLEQHPDHERAILLLSDTARTTEQVKELEQHLASLNNKNTVAYHLGLARIAARKKDLDLNVASIKRALEIDPKSAAAHLAMGEWHLRRKETDKAGQSIKLASEFAPLRSTGKLKYAEFLLQTADYAAARKLLEKITAGVPDLLPSWNLLARVASKEGKHDEALAALENVFARDPGNPSGRLLEAQVKLANGDPDGAVKGLESLSDQFGNRNSLVDYQLARMYLATGSPTKASATLEKVLSGSPDFLEASLLQARLNLQQGEALAVVSAMQRVLEKRRGLEAAELLLADAYRVLNRPDDAAAIFREQIKRSPNNSGAYFFLGTVLRQQKKLAEAREAFAQALVRSPDNPLPLFQLADMDMAEGKFDAAIERINPLLKVNPDSPSANLMLGKIHVAGQKWNEAERAFLKVVEKRPDSVTAYNLLIGVYLKTKQLPEAATRLEAALKDNPDDLRKLRQAGMIYDRMGQRDKAKSKYQQIIAKNPDSAIAHNNLALIYSEHSNDPEKAYESAQKARALKPESGAIADTLGWIVYQRGDYRRAVSLLLESAAELSGNPEVQYHLGMAQYMTGRIAEAKAAFEAALASEDEFPGTEDARDRLFFLNELSGASIGELRSRSEKDPKDVVALSQLAKSLGDKDEHDESAEIYGRVLAINADHVTAIKELARLHAGPLGDLERALEYAKQARELAPDDPEVAGVLGSVASLAGDFSWAQSLLQPVVRQNPKDMDLARHLAMALYGIGKTSEALKTMQPVAASGSDREDEYFVLMVSLAQDPEKLFSQESEIAKVLEATPNFLPGLMASADLEVQRGELESARKAYEEILERFPEFIPAQMRVAPIYADQPNKLDDALNLATSARRALPDDIKSAYALAYVRYKRKEFPRALSLLTGSAAQSALAPPALHLLGLVQFESGKLDDSKVSFEKAVADGLDEPRLTAAKQKLAELARRTTPNR